MEVEINPLFHPTKENPADVWFRQLCPLSKSDLDESTFQAFLRHFKEWMQLQTDWMCLLSNAMSQNFVAGRPLQDAWEVHIFSRDLSTFEVGWYNPPWSLLPRLLQFLVREEITRH